jgi:DNA polymerase elongation subunit (family B)
MQGIADVADTPSGLGDFMASDTLNLKVMNVAYTDSKYGTTVHVFGRDENREWHHIEVEGHNPSFYIREEEYTERVDNHYAVQRTEKYDEDGERYKSLHGEPLVRVYTFNPSQVGDMKELFHWTGEADVFYHKRWLIDSEVKTGIRIDTSDADTDEYVTGDMRVKQSAVEPLSLDETPTLEPKTLALDIEVAGEDGVPDADRGEYPVSTIVAWDNYEEKYIGWILHDETCDWNPDKEFTDENTELDETRVYDDESDMLYNFNKWVAEKRPDIITGWYSNDFDIPYLVNRCRHLNTYNYQQWSPLGDVYLTRFDPAVKGVSCVDMLGAYQKTQIHNLTSKKLDDIGEAVVGKKKVEHELDYTEMWRERPEKHLHYNKVDVELVHLIDDEAGALDLLDNLRGVVGCSYTAPIGGNIDMMDMVFLRKAKEYGYALPTAVEPDTGYYHGAYVYTPTAGLHEHVVYPDYSSLYPNIMYQCNISPETLIGTEEALEESEYTEDDCVWTYIDATTPPSLKEDVEAKEERMEKLYFIKPSIQEGFVRSVLDDIMGLASQYTGGMYAAVKRVRNSTYGVMGDSDSYNVGFRLFDWRLAEGTTLGGQKVLKEGGKKFTEFIDDPDAEVIYGDTDSVVTTIPNADSPEDALETAQHAGEQLNEYLDEYAAETFGLESPDDARMEIEIETYADAIFFKGQDDGESDEGIKKRYVQQTRWDDDDFWLDEPELIIKGFEYVRSDIAAVTADVQYETFQLLMEHGSDGAKERVMAYVRDVISDIMAGDYDMADVGIPFGISQSLDEYGSPERKPQPQYRGAKFANKELYEGEVITEGDKPKYYYIKEGATGESLRKTYDSYTAEDGAYVDCISVDEWSDMPDDVVVDREKMIDKTIISPMEDIFRTLGWGADWMERAVENAKSPEDYRDADQLGLDASSFM